MPPFSSTFRFAIVRPSRSRWLSSRNRARRSSPAPPDPCRRLCPRSRRRRTPAPSGPSGEAGRDRQPAAVPGIACSAFSITLVRRPREQRPVDRHRREIRRRLRPRSRCVRPVRRDTGSTTSSMSAGSSVGSGCAVGDEAKLENSAAICRSSLTCVRIEPDAFVEHRRQRPARDPG